MALNTDPNFPPGGSAPYQIDREWCLGDSLTYINLNSANFDSRIETLSTNTNTRITNLSTEPYARLNDGNQTGVAPIYGCRAWVNFDAFRNSSGGTDSLNTARFIRGQGNVSSVQRNNLGDYTINFTIPMPNSNYCVFGSGMEDNGGLATRATAISLYTNGGFSNTSVRVLNANIDSNDLRDGEVITVSVIC